MGALKQVIAKVLDPRPPGELRQPFFRAPGRTVKRTCDLSRNCRGCIGIVSEIVR